MPLHVVALHSRFPHIYHIISTFIVVFALFIYEFILTVFYYFIILLFP